MKFFVLLVAIGITSLANAQQYAILDIAFGVGGGTFLGAHGAPDFDMDCSGLGFDPLATFIYSDPYVPGDPGFSDLFGDASSQDSLRLTTISQGGFVGDTITDSAMSAVSIDFEEDTDPGMYQLGFAIADVEAEDVIIQASLNGVPYTSAEVGAWFRGAFDSRTDLFGIDDIPTWSATDSAIIGSLDFDGVLDDQMLAVTGNADSPSAWFLVTDPVDLILITHRNRYTGTPAGVQIFFAVAEVPPETFVRSDTNGDGSLDISDVVSILSSLFVAGTPPLPCDDAGDCNDDGSIDISDAIYALAALFVPGSSQPTAPYPFCGVDPSVDLLQCDLYVCP